MEISLQCAIPGSHKDRVADGTDAYWGSDGLQHGLCGNASTSFVASASASGYETVHGKADKSRPISNVQLGSPISYLDPNTRFSSTLKGSTSLDSATPGDYYAIWDSTDGNGTYHHYGLAEVTAVDNAHPNHS
ncbi:MAG: hypothetical protein LKE61_10735 [Erysipelotrichaceae bacterium]|jgi:hypothetical protein|nr:hypothetical protein [Erysipelotrichaceae bacterium]MCH4043660.1 hypothetical protein [Erysipelotrichaceae bacterium]MCH4120879.1 hypothetical protein [Erysipelotrichaceae bacterium]